MAKAIELFPELQGLELDYIQSVIGPLSDEEAIKFLNIYRARRKRPEDILIFSIIGLFLIPGLQRFFLNQIGMGILFFFTIGLCFIGSIIDLVNYQKMTFEFNQRVADEVRMGLGM
ncbi:TM2 domain-containing protein [Fulvivirga sedimenti]|uniref:TM2 domain-containing protein n=1 Tax=Fulvivirga sedimenti TaxID=2879465 RepID=A0A9X1HPN8_9BACT|nr:TM2 domain-containing protein [Fulvivirga sedimenti]MCA6075536.1 TM2 domain-containing protein [Fulvivirga sedimenti]MCA6076713.1 TM2 domain-containing protein [Fulvivirga sedimenti]MCA6077841.1 TM2 domain-containing protein [Fulvivirga sedimenti]